MMVTPTDQTSQRPSYSVPPSTTSGAIQCGVPALPRASPGPAQQIP